MSTQVYDPDAAIHPGEQVSNVYTLYDIADRQYFS